MHNPRRFFFPGALLGALLFLSTPAFAADVPGAPVTQSPALAEGQLQITADSISYAEGEERLIASGNTQIRYGQFAISGQECSIDRSTGKGFIKGDVHLSVEQADISAESMDFALDTGMGTLAGANGVLGNNLSFTAAKIERKGKDRYLIEDGTLTSCPANQREWVFKARRLDVRLEGLAWFEGVSLRFYGVPVFYAPYWFAPAVTKRTSGFLMPGIGFSNTSGMQVKNSLFWAKSDQDDATVYLDWMERRGLREGLEYRYAFAERTYGHANIDYIYDKYLDTPIYSAKVDHRMKVNEYADTMARVDIESRTSYSKEFDTSTYMRTRRYTDSYANVHFTGGSYALSVTGRDQRELEVSGGEIFSKRPEVLFSAMPQSLGGLPLVAEGEASGATFYTNRFGDDKVGRFDMRPRVSAPFTASPLLNVTPWAELRQTWYTRSAAERTPLTVGYYAAGVQLEGPRLYRVFENGENAWKHSLTPRFDLDYVPGYEVAGNDRQMAAQLDTRDDSAPKSVGTFSLLNRLYSRARADELVRLIISQGYDFREASRTGGGEKRPYTNLSTELKSRPTDWLLLNGDMAYSHYLHKPVTANVELGFEWDDLHFSYDRRYVFTPRETYDTGLVGYRFNQAFSAEFSAIYDEERRETTASLATLNWESCCWGVSLNAETRRRAELLASGLARQETEHRFFFAIFLKGIGDLGEKRAPLVARKLADTADR